MNLKLDRVRGNCALGHRRLAELGLKARGLVALDPLNVTAPGTQPWPGSAR